jgi:hypothetical protein
MIVIMLLSASYPFHDALRAWILLAHIDIHDCAIKMVICITLPVSVTTATV